MKETWKPGTLIYPLPAILVSSGSSPDDYNMFILHRVKKYTLAEIAEKFDISAPTASRRINDFAEAALKLYRQYQREMEN